ncbi:YczE/YyaS/YitT family protein [Lactobacillus agrestimuris]|uniref:YczE/YyaS/YitT family protein n=1 Tax=Lactobacillus agrestimuris TaxID=2941328 RepID=UPI0020440B37|nr:membrane protein [Lactobacillus agrestimuris]
MKKSRPVVNISLKTLMSFIGITILSMGATFLRGGGVGMDPFTALNMGISNHLHIGLGIFQLAFNFVIFLFILWLDRKKIGIGTFLNMVLVGFEIQGFDILYKQWFGSRSGFFVIAADLIIGLLLFTLGASLYMGPNLGVAPYDAIAPIITSKTNLPYRWVRVAQDVLFMVCGWLVGGPVGIATIIVAFFTGPLISWWDSHVSKPLVSTIDEATSPERRLNVVTSLLKHLGTRTLNTIRNTYDATEQIQRNAVTYSTSDLKTQLKIVRRNMTNSKQMYDSFVEQEKLIEAEINKRVENAKSKNE